MGIALILSTFLFFFNFNFYVSVDHPLAILSPCMFREVIKFFYSCQCEATLSGSSSNFTAMIMLNLSSFAVTANEMCITMLLSILGMSCSRSRVLFAQCLIFIILTWWT